MRCSVARGSMPYSPVTQPLPLPFRNEGTPSSTRGRADHARLADFDQHAAFGDGDEIRRDFHRAHLVRGTSVASQVGSWIPVEWGF